MYNFKLKLHSFLNSLNSSLFSQIKSMSIVSTSESSVSRSRFFSIASYSSTPGIFYGYIGTSISLDRINSLLSSAKNGWESTSSLPPLLPNRSYLSFERRLSTIFTNSSEYSMLYFFLLGH